ncbi:MAG: hypothetical protein HY779_06500, partial [Rubrobacteridae bacterium]|nr:hypothetical protein [Rubrobacteridae bacterium]
MSFFNIKNGELNRVTDPETISSEKIEWLADRLILPNDIMPEKLMAIGRYPINETAPYPTYLLSIDKCANLVVTFIFAAEPAARDISDACELAWNLRHVSFDELERCAAKHFASLGINNTNLAESHARYFEISRAFARRRFNENQRIIVLAPRYGRSAYDAICWRRSEIDITAFALNLVDID